jgi:hypothetical protein
MTLRRAHIEKTRKRTVVIDEPKESGEKRRFLHRMLSLETISSILKFDLDDERKSKRRRKFR